MSDNEATKSGKTLTAWSDKERLTYLVALVEQTAVKLDFENTPRPAGRSALACQRMVERLKVTLTDELEALKAGQPISGDGEATAKTPKTPKRKSKAAANGNEEASPMKRGRPSKAKAAAKNKEADTEDVKMENGDDEI